MASKPHSLSSRLIGSAIATCFAGAVGCGTPAAPSAPSLNLPNPVLNLTAMRVGDSVKLTWTMPSRTTDKVVLRNPVDVQVCRALETGPCTPVGNVNAAPAGPGVYTDALPQDLSQGADRLLRYEVSMRNHAGKSAGPSNAAYSVAGASPAPLNGLTGQVRADGVLLTWQPVPEPGRPTLFRIERVQVNVPAEAERPRSALAPSTQPLAQTLAVRSQNGADPGHAIDASAQFNQQYRYTLERVATPDLSGHPLEVQGPPSEAIVVATTDKFPPAVPQGLVAVADPVAGAIDLSWTPDTEMDLAAYRIYRRDMQGGAAERIASLPETSFRDTQVKAGHSYAYAVSAIDQSDNESRPSSEAQETLPRP